MLFVLLYVVSWPRIYDLLFHGISWFLTSNAHHLFLETNDRHTGRIWPHIPAWRLTTPCLQDNFPQSNFRSHSGSTCDNLRDTFGLCQERISKTVTRGNLQQHKYRVRRRAANCCWLLSFVTGDTLHINCSLITRSLVIVCIVVTCYGIAFANRIHFGRYVVDVAHTPVIAM